MKVAIRKKLGIWFFALSLIGLQMLFTNVGFSQESTSWQKTVSQGGECKIEFPSAPQVIQQSLPIAGTSSKLSYDVYIAPHDDKGVFLLLIATYPISMGGAGHEIAGLEGLISGIVNHHPENQLVYAEMTELVGNPAVNFLVEGGGSYFRGQAVMIGNKLYLIAMEGLKDELREDVFNKFLSSFKVVNP